MKKINIEYCYLDDALGTPFDPELYRANEGKYGKVGDIDYEDPDAVSGKLYEDLCKLWSIELDKDKEKDKLTFIFTKHDKLLNLVDQYGRRYSSDFIGPSRAWAKYVLIEDIQIGEYLKKARTIGGHVIWPLNGTPRTINTARGGGNSVYDRIDLTLTELRNYYMGGSYWFSKGLWSMFEREEGWLSNFRDTDKDGLFAFKTFVDYWNLNSFVYGDDYKVISLACSDYKNGNIVIVSKEEPIFPENSNKIGYKDIIKLNESEDLIYANKLKEAYVKYIANNLFAIEKRNKEIEEKFD